MIHYALKCDQGHDFDSWFQSAAAFDALARAGHLSCSVCGSGDVKKAIMAPRVMSNSVANKVERKAGETQEASVPMLKSPQNDVEIQIAELRKKVEETSEYVGNDFARQARAMHLGDVPERAIYGEARADQARSLIEDGVPLVPLPFRPRQKMS